MSAFRAFCAATLILAAASTGHAKVRTPSADDKLQAACYPDVRRLCADAIPDEGKIRACMQGKKSMISEKCLRAAKEAGR